MTKRDYARATALVQAAFEVSRTETEMRIARGMIDVFIIFFEDDNPKFDKVAFRKACHQERGNGNE